MQQLVSTVYNYVKPYRQLTEERVYHCGMLALVCCVFALLAFSTV